MPAANPDITRRFRLLAAVVVMLGMVIGGGLTRLMFGVPVAPLGWRLLPVTASFPVYRPRTVDPWPQFTRLLA